MHSLEKCPEALHWHGEPNSTGHCPYCGKVLCKRSKPNFSDPFRRDDRQDYYDYFYSPDGPS